MISSKNVGFGKGFFAAVAFFCAISNMAFAGWNLNEKESLFGVFTRKTGIAAGFAHNHLITAAKVKIENLRVGEPLNQSTLKLTFPVEALDVDAPELQKKWKPLLEKLNVVNSDIEMGELSNDQRTEIKEKMMADGQLDQKQFPEMVFTLKSIESVANTKSDQLKATAKIHGVEKEIVFDVTYDQKDKKAIILSGVAKSKFSDFGIKPFSMVVVGNEDEFSFVLKAVLRAE